MRKQGEFGVVGETVISSIKFANLIEITSVF